EIRVLQAREQARAGAPEGAGATPNLNPAPSTTTTTVTNAQLQAMIDQGVNTALAARDANRTGDDSHTSGTGVRRTERVARECTYQDFMKCQPLYFKGTEGVVELTQWMFLFMIRVTLGGPTGIREFNSWVWGHKHMGCWGRGVGIIWVSEGA
nr:hypothetical protein [Tanacetum cinerariifolium]